MSEEVDAGAVQAQPDLIGELQAILSNMRPDLQKKTKPKEIQVGCVGEVGD